MSVDTYAICPCGSGKKIKFCKCKDSLGEMDKVLKMVEGGQMVPALDRLSNILQQHPDAAWALAVRGRLLISLREYDSLAENAERFIRLQPSNPLALTQRSASQLFAGEIQAATGSLLEALTESGRDVDAFVLDVSSILSVALAQSGVVMTARNYATLSLMADYEDGAPSAADVLKQINGSPNVNHLLKSVNEPIERPADVEWGERFDEALGLLRSNQILLAQSKLDSLQRVAPLQPAILSGLLTCAIWSGDAQAQSDLLKKLSSCESLDFAQRCRFLAQSVLVDVKESEMHIPTFQLNAKIEKADEAEMAMTAHARVVALPADMATQMRTSEDEVPPKAVFQIIDRDKPESLDELPPVEEVPEAIATVLLFGKQTDRDARIEAMNVFEHDVEACKKAIQDAIGDVTLESEKTEPLPFLVASQPQPAMLRFKAKPADAEVLQHELMQQRLAKQLTSLKLPMLGDRSLVEVADDESLLLQRTAVAKIIENYDAITSRSANVVSEVYELAKLEQAGEIILGEEQTETVANEDLNRVNPEALSPESLMYLLQRASHISARPALRRFAEALISAELTDDQKPVRMLAYNAMISASHSTGEALEWIDKAKAYAQENGAETAELLLNELPLRLQAGDAEGFQSTIQSITTRYGNHPEVMAQLQRILMSLGLIRPDGSPVSQPAAPGPGAAMDPAGATPAGDGIWTPDSAPAPKSAEGGSKLWVPGMD